MPFIVSYFRPYSLSSRRFSARLCGKALAIFGIICRFQRLLQLARVIFSIIRSIIHFMNIRACFYCNSFLLLCKYFTFHSFIFIWFHNGLFSLFRIDYEEDYLSHYVLVRETPFYPGNLFIYARMRRPHLQVTCCVLHQLAMFQSGRLMRISSAFGSHQFLRHLAVNQAVYGRG